MVLGDAQRDGQAQAGALRLRGDVGLEEAGFQRLLECPGPESVDLEHGVGA
jgi:hypothetical protein